MKRAIKILLVSLVILTGCKSMHKTTTALAVKSSEQTELIQQVKTLGVSNIQNDLNSELETTTVTTVTEYYEPVITEQSGSDIPEKGSVKKEITTISTTKKKDSDNSTVASVNTQLKDSSIETNKATAIKSESKEVKKKGVPLWQIIVLLLAFLVIVYFLVKNSSVRIPFLSKVVDLIGGLFKRTSV